MNASSPHSGAAGTASIISAIVSPTATIAPKTVLTSR
jgi:hypothetical protein